MPTTTAWRSSPCFGNQAAKLAAARGEHERAAASFAAKPILLRAALTAPGAMWWAAPHGWGQGSTALFIEVAEPVGQIAFHILDDEPALRDLLENAPSANGRRWDGLPKQERAGELTRKWLAHHDEL